MLENCTVLNKEGIDMLDEIVRNGAISDTSLRMLVKKIIITERKGKMKIKIHRKTVVKSKRKPEKPEFSRLFGFVCKYLF